MAIGGHSKPVRGFSDEWLTPPGILQHLGRFDLDPCSPATSVGHRRRASVDRRQWPHRGLGKQARVPQPAIWKRDFSVDAENGIERKRHRIDIRAHRDQLVFQLSLFTRIGVAVSSRPDQLFQRRRVAISVQLRGAISADRLRQNH